MSSSENEISPFRTWNGRDPFAIFPGVNLHAIGGEQALLCRVVYDPGKTVERHSHPHSEQVMAIVDGEVEITIGNESRTMRTGDVCVMNRGVEHELHTVGGVTFFEALAPVTLDHVSDRELDLVLGPDGGAGHVAR
jgi:quercetin dioxygenase-like cupin family protein